MSYYNDKCDARVFGAFKLLHRRTIRFIKFPNILISRLFYDMKVLKCYAKMQSIQNINYESHETYKIDWRYLHR